MRLKNPLLAAAFAAWIARISGANEANAVQAYATENSTVASSQLTSSLPETNTTVAARPAINQSETEVNHIEMMREKLIQQVKNGAPIFSVTIKLPKPKGADEKAIMAHVKKVLNRKPLKKKGRALRGEEVDEQSISDILAKNQAFLANATSTDQEIRISLPGLSEVDAQAIMQLAEDPKNGTTVSRSINLINIEDTMEAEAVDRRGLSAATASQLYKFHPNVDSVDGVAGGTSWLNEIGIVGKKFMYGQLDSGIHQKHVDTADMEINTYECTQGVECTYTQVSANVQLAQRLDSLDPSGHGSHVYGDAARVAPGMTAVDNFRVLDATGHGGYEMIEAGIDACIARLEQLKKDAARNGAEPNKYILNASIGFRDFGEIPGIISKQQAEQNTATIKRIFKKIEDMHAKYPWFQMVTAAGNSGYTNVEMPGCITPVIAVASHDATFSKSPTTNTVAHVSAIGVGVTSTGNVGLKSTTLKSGTSMASPVVAASLGLLWELFPNLKNTELKQLIQDISADPSEYSWSAVFPIKNRIFIIDINKCINLARADPKHKYYVDPGLLGQMKAKASSYALDNLPVGDQPVFTLPNSSPVPLPVNGVATFTIDLTTKTPGTLTVAFSNKRAVQWDKYWEEIGWQDIAPFSLFTQPFDIPIKKDTTKITITIKRGSSPGGTLGGSKASFVVKDQSGNTLRTIPDTPMAGYGDIQNLMAAISRSSSGIVINSCIGKPGAAVDATPPPIVFTPPTTSNPTPKATNTPTLANTPISLSLVDNVPSLVSLVPINDNIEIVFGNKKLLIQAPNFSLFEKNNKGRFLPKEKVLGTAPELKPGEEIILKLSSIGGKLVLEQQISSKNRRTKKITITYNPLCEVKFDGAQRISFAQVDNNYSKILPSAKKPKING